MTRAVGIPGMARTWILGAAWLAAASAFAAPSSSATAAQTARDQAIAELRALDGAMPRSFDLVLTDPCSGTWDILHADGSLALKITVLRYRGLPIMHVSGEGFGASNNAAVRQDPQSVAVTAGSMKITLRCVGDKASMELLTGPVEVRRRQLFAGRRGAPEPLAPMAAANSTEMTGPGVRIVRGNVQYRDPAGRTRFITTNDNNRDAVISSDGRTIAFIHQDGKPTEEGESGFDSLWVADGVTGEARRVLSPRPDRQPERNLASFQHPRFSLDGGFLYIDADAWTTSSAVHQVNVQTGTERFVIDGSTVSVIRTGPYRGYLLVQRHEYKKPPGFGAIDPVYVVRPDGKAILKVPSSDVDDGKPSVADWLAANHWDAW